MAIGKGKKPKELLLEAMEAWRQTNTPQAGEPVQDGQAAQERLEALRRLRAAAKAYEAEILTYGQKKKNRAIIDLYGLEAFDESNPVHIANRTLLGIFGIDGLSYKGEYPLPPGYWSKDMIAYIASSQGTIKAEMGKRPSGRRPSVAAPSPGLRPGASLAIPSGKDYIHALSTYPNGKAFMAKLEKSFLAEVKFEENGRAHWKAAATLPKSMLGEIKAHDVRKDTSHSDNMRLFAGVYSALYKQYEATDGKCLDGYNFETNYTDLCEYFGVNADHRERPGNLFDRIQAFENWVGIMDNMTVIRVLMWASLNLRTGRIVLTVPYFVELIKEMERDKLTTQKLAALPMHTNLIKASIVGAGKDDHAAEIVGRLAVLLAQGPQDGPEVAISYKRLVEETPEFHKYLESIKGPGAGQKKAVYLARTFKNVYSYLYEHTTIFRDYKSLKVNGKDRTQILFKDLPPMPLYSHLADREKKFVITHEGKIRKNETQEIIGKNDAQMRV